jgi:hypothetical protein
MQIRDTTVQMGGGLPMMVPALVIDKGSGDDNEGCSDKINTTTTMVGLTVELFGALRRDFSIMFPAN